MSQPVLLVLVGVAVILIVVGRISRKSRYGSLVAVAGFAVLAPAALLRFLVG